MQGVIHSVKTKASCRHLIISWNHRLRTPKHLWDNCARLIKPTLDHEYKYRDHEGWWRNRHDQLMISQLKSGWHSDASLSLKIQHVASGRRNILICHLCTIKQLDVTVLWSQQDWFDMPVLVVKTQEGSSWARCLMIENMGMSLDHVELQDTVLCGISIVRHCWTCGGNRSWHVLGLPKIQEDQLLNSSKKEILWYKY